MQVTKNFQIVLQNSASEATLVAMIAARESMLTKLRNANDLENEGTESLCSSLVAYASIQVSHRCNNNNNLFTYIARVTCADAHTRITE